MVDDVYNYQIDGTLEDPDGNQVGADGSFQVDYTTGSVSNINLDVAKGSYNIGELTSSKAADGTTEYSIKFTYFPEPPPFQGTNFTITYDTQFPPFLDTASLYEIVNPNDDGVAPRSDTYSATRLQTASNQITICFATGTLIGTDYGAVPVEHLHVGDRATTAEGICRRIRWIGRRTVETPTFEQCPVRIRAGAFGAGRPERDLFLSPGHPVLVGAQAGNKGGHLVPIMCLINGTTIARQPVATVTYWHVELDAHDILLAEGLPAESYLDWGSRPWFAGGDGALLDPDLTLSGMTGRCRPVAVDGPVVEAERRRLDQVFAMDLAGHCQWANLENATLLPL